MALRAVCIGVAKKSSHLKKKGSLVHDEMKEREKSSWVKPVAKAQAKDTITG